MVTLVDIQKSLDEIIKIRMRITNPKPKKSDIRARENEAHNYNLEHDSTSYRKAPVANIDTVDYNEVARRKIVDSRREQAGKEPKYGKAGWWKSTEGTKKPEKHQLSTVAQQGSSTSGQSTQQSKPKQQTHDDKPKDQKTSHVKDVERKMIEQGKPKTTKRKKVVPSYNLATGSSQSEQGVRYEKEFKRHQDEINRRKKERRAKEDFYGKSIDTLQSYIQGMIQIVKQGRGETGFNTRVTGTNVNTKIRQVKDEGKLRSKPKEVKTGSGFNLQSRIGDPAVKSVLNDSFNQLLDSYQYKYKYRDFQTGEEMPEVTTDISRTPRGSDHRAKRKPLGSSREDQKVIQS